MTDSSAAAAAIAPDPARHLHLVQSSADLLQRLRTARSDYAHSINHEREVVNALARAEADAKIASFSRQAAARVSGAS